LGGMQRVSVHFIELLIRFTPVYRVLMIYMYCDDPHRLDAPITSNFLAKITLINAVIKINETVFRSGKPQLL